jgi:hypothetical protein
MAFVRMRSVRDASELPSFGIYPSLEAELFAARRVFNGDVVLACPADFQVRLFQDLEDVSATCDLAFLNLHDQVGVDGVLGFRAFVFAGRFSPADQTSPAQVRVFWRVQASAGRIVRSGPAFAMIVQVAEYVEVLLPARRAGVERLAARQLHAWDDEVQLMVLSMTMPYPEHVSLVRLQPGESHGLEVVHDALFLLGRHAFVRVPGQHPRSELPFGVQGIDQRPRQLRITTQHLWRMLVPVRVVRAHKIVRRPIAPTLAVREDFHVHGVSEEGSTPKGEKGLAYHCLPRLRSTLAPFRC